MSGAGRADPSGPFDPVAEDPPGLDPLHPAGLAEVGFRSHGALVNGVLLVAEGPGPHPTALILHGFPGYERNLDLAHAIRRAGWNSLVFHYRGAWGSEGAYRFRHVLEDILEALGFVAGEGRETHRCDPGRIVLVGHSLGGFAALMTVAARPDLLGACSIGGYSLGAAWRAAQRDPAVMEATMALFRDELRPLRDVTADTLRDEVAQHGDEWDPATHAEVLADRPLLLLAGSRDEPVPPEIHHHPLVRAVESHGAAWLEHHVWDTDHPFSDRRVALARLIVDWLGRLPAP